MSKEKKDGGKGLGKFVERSLTPGDGVTDTKDMSDTTIFESHQAFSQDYNATKRAHLSKGFNFTFITIMILIIAGLFYTSLVSKKLTVVYAYEDKISVHEFNLSYSNKITIKDTFYIDPSSEQTIYGGYYGELALLARAIDDSDAAIIICDDTQILELASIRYLLSVPDVLENDIEKYNEVLGIKFENKGFYGMKTLGSINAMPTNELMTFNEVNYMAFTKNINNFNLRRNVKRFLELYYE